ncbi:MAG TPA: glycerol-3-phosphate 1-O-acyltransferase PlsY [Terracidiphilus sp.]|jgi:glycerol-3-phosphate acyltransferase PlsY|nr:glycerol-3-phosphate 1-O-acyltransferase PlsY [Terracidiphilus sp.]
MPSSPFPATLVFEMLLASLLIAVLAYLLGSIPTGYLLMRFFRKQDIRTIGSGNIGATNVLRSGSKGLGAVTFLLDMFKGCAAVWLGSMFWFVISLSTAPGSGLPLRDLQAIAAVSAVIGHMFPVWLRFKGGKGVATGFGVFLVAAPLAALAAITVFAIVLGLSRYVSLASILGSASFPLFAFFLVAGDKPPLFIAAQFIVAFLIIAKHHQNIRRLLAGTESRFGSSHDRQGTTA